MIEHAVALISAARAKGPWTVQPDGRIRNDHLECPLAAVLGRWMRGPGDPWWYVQIIEAADFPRSKHRQMLTQGLGMQRA